MKTLLCLFFICCSFIVSAQVNDTSDVQAVRNVVTLSEVVVRSDLNIPKFLQRIKYDTSYYKSFKNLHVLGYTSLNYIRMMDKKGKTKAAMESKTRQNVKNGCRTMDVLEENTTGDFYDSHHDYNYYTAELYATFFFSKGMVCGENNIVKGSDLNVHGKHGLDKHTEQLKMLFFNPGKRIPGIPFIGDKLDVFDPQIASHYDFSIDTSDLNGHPCYIFRIETKKDLTSSQRDDIVFDNITTWFDQRTMEIIGRNYDLSYGAGVYNFDVHMQVEMTKFGEYTVPQILRYSGNWYLMFKGREKGMFTATLYDFKK
jgi:hypothetical protein